MILIRIIPFKQDAFLERQLSRESVEKHRAGLPGPQ